VSNTKKPARRGIADVLASARLRETEVRLCLAGDLAADADRLQAELDALGSKFAPSSLAESDPRAALSSELAEVHDLMRENEATFRFRALGKAAYSDLLAAHPARSADEAWNADTLPPALIAACCIEPEVTPEQFAALDEVLNQRQRSELWTAAWSAQVGETRVPISRAASTSP
jgi:hypothetical protein